MVDQLIQFILLFVGFALHALSILYERNKAAAETITLANVIWDDAEKYRTVMLTAFMLIITLTGSVNSMFAAAGITVDGMTGLSILLISGGYNIDSLSTKVLSMAKPKAA